MIFGLGSNLGKTMEIFELGLNASVLRREVISDNIANADTPSFKRSEVSFESQLRRAVASEQKPEFPAMMTNERHISFSETIDYKTVDPRISTAFDSNYRNDENNVDIDKEMIDSAKNSMYYNALMEIYSRNIKILDIVIR